MRTIKRITSAFLAVLLVAGAIAGCGVDEKEGNSQESETPSVKPAAMGRFKEEEIRLPEEVRDHWYYTAFKGKDNKLELYTGERMADGRIGKINRYIFDNSSWENDENWWGAPLLDKYGLSFEKVVYGMDGKYYMSGTDDSYRYHLYQVSEDGTAVELLEDLFKPEEGKSYGLFPRKVAVTAGGNLVLYSYEETYLYQPDGEKLFTMTQDFWGNTDDKNMFVNGNDFVTILDGSVVRYSLLDGQMKETIPYDGLKNGVNGVSAVMFPDKNGGIYVANEKGLVHVNQGGTVWENLIDGSLNSMGMRSLTMREFMEGDNGDYYGIYTDVTGNGPRMYHYVYDKDMAAVPPTTLTVYALHDNSTVRQAAALLQKDNPDVRVDFRVAIQDDDNSMTEDVIRSLNTELLGGKGADVLILDGLPVESYIEKGVLMDMKGVFARIQKEVPICDNILAGFTEGDGSVYEMPARIAFPVAMGEASAITAFSSMEAMVSYPGELPLTGAETYENLLRLMANIHYQELFGNGLGGLNEEVVLKYLESVKAVGESIDARSVFTKEEMEYAMTNNNAISSGIRGNAMNYDRGMTSGALEYFDSISSTAIAWAVMDKHPGTEMKLVNGVYFPSAIVGINQATTQKETAEQFISYLFSTAVQKVNFYDGFPVQTEALDHMETEESNLSYMIGSSSYGNYTLSAGWPSKEKREYVLGLIPQLTVPVEIDEIVMEMITSESENYFEGKEDAAQAASAISQKIKLYLAE